MLNDFRYAVRMVLKRPGFTTVVVLTLALGIGANTAIFTLVNSLLLRPLPYQDPERLVWVENALDQPIRGTILGHHYLDWKEQTQTLEQVAAYTPSNHTLAGVGDPQRLDTSRVTGDFFNLLGVRPFLGRSFSPAEDSPGIASHVVILSYNFWQRQFDSDRTIIGRTIRLDDHDHTVVGVMPPDFRFAPGFDAYVPLALDTVAERGNQRHSNISVVARLRAGIRMNAAQAEMQSILMRPLPVPRPGVPPEIRLVPLHEKLVGDVRSFLLLLQCTVVAVLLIACANVANLLLSRAAIRQREFAVRAAMGAGRLALIRQLLIESTLLSLVGATLGLLFAHWLIQAFVTLVASGSIAADIARVAAVRLDLRVLGFTILVALLTGIGFGLVPALRLSRPSLTGSLREHGHSGGVQRFSLQRLFMVAEVAMAIVLLTSAGLVVRSFVKLLEVNPGYRTEQLLTLKVSLPESRYPDFPSKTTFYQELLRRIAALPGTQFAGVINHLPLTSITFSGQVRTPGRAANNGNDQTHTAIGLVSKNYFEAMGIPLIAGRFFTDADNSDSSRVVILSQALAQEAFPGEDPLGKQLWIPGPGKGNPTVVGIVADIKQFGLDKDVMPQAYSPYLQYPQNSMTIIARTTTAPANLAPAIRQEVLALDRELPIYEVQTMEHRVANSVSTRRTVLSVLGLFAAAAVVLAALGIYGVFSYVVTQRTSEIGIRITLGASRGNILRQILRDSMLLTGFGTAIGLLSSLGTTHLLNTLLFGIRPVDPITFLAVPLILLLVALLASILPAWRAANVDPMVALRSV